MTRREWILELGAGVALTGWSAADLQAAELPPGVYLPSRDHLSHALAGHELAAGTATELVEVWKGPAFFRPEEYRVVGQLIATLLGETPYTPVVNEIAQWVDRTVAESAAVRAAARSLSSSHRTLAVHYYGADAVRHLEDFDAQTVCREGLAWLQARGELAAVVRSISDDQPPPRVRNAGTRFFDYLKRRVAEGFYTSRPGLEELGRGNPLFSASPPGCSH